jgi:hypothetical protein
MLQLPVGFDINLFVGDYFALVVPFVALALLFVAYRLIVKAMSGRV